jgi:hypothetical protein
MSRIVVEVNAKGVDKWLKFMNLYDPYSNRLQFLNNLKEKWTLSGGNMIIGGDLNLTLN